MPQLGITAAPAPQQQQLRSTRAHPRCAPCSSRAPLQPQPRPSRTPRAVQHQASSAAQGREAAPAAAEPRGFFDDAFTSVLTQALERSAEGLLINHEPTPAEPAPLPSRPPPAAPSAQEDMLSAALEASQTALSRLVLIRNEVERAIERENTQIARLMFAVDKAKKDEAYYRVLRAVQERGASDQE